MLTFILIYREDLRNRLIRLAGTGDIHRTTTAMDEAGRRLSRLFATQLLINTTTGAFIGVAFFLLGIPGALLWGILTAVLRFVPYVGTLLASIFPIIIAAAVGDGWTLALLTLGIVVVTEVAGGPGAGAAVLRQEHGPFARGGRRGGGLLDGDLGARGAGALHPHHHRAAGGGPQHRGAAVSRGAARLQRPC